MDEIQAKPRGDWAKHQVPTNITSGRFHSRIAFIKLV